MYDGTVSLRPGKTVRDITLPNVRTLHVFAIAPAEAQSSVGARARACQPQRRQGPAVIVQAPRPAAVPWFRVRAAGTGLRPAP